MAEKQVRTNHRILQECEEQKKILENKLAGTFLKRRHSLELQLAYYDSVVGRLRPTILGSVDNIENRTERETVRLQALWTLNHTIGKWEAATYIALALIPLGIELAKLHAKKMEAKGAKGK